LWLANRDKVPDRSRLPHEVHEKVFGWVLALVAERGLVKSERIGVDGSTMEANALRTIARRDSGETYREMLGRMGVIGLAGRLHEPVEAAFGQQGLQLVVKRVARGARHLSLDQSFGIELFKQIVERLRSYRTTVFGSSKFTRAVPITLNPCAWAARSLPG